MSGNLLVVGGYGVGGLNSAKVPIELIDVSSPYGSSGKCAHTIQQYPERDTGEAVVLLQGKIPVICGDNNSRRNHCYRLINGKWVQGPNLSTRHSHTSAFTLNDTAWMVVGGRNTAATEILSLDGSSRQGPSLPKTIYIGCSVKINDTTAIVMGGNQQNTYYYSIDKEEWSQGPSVSVRRYSQSCGLVEDLVDPETRYVIYSGGVVTEILQVGAEKWARGPNFLWQ